jgi:hypothetical protein
LPHEGEEVETDDHVRLRIDHTRGRRILAVRIFKNGHTAGATPGAERSADAERV